MTASTLIRLDPAAHMRLSPTDIAQFIRLEQCERYLALQLYQRTEGPGCTRHFGFHALSTR